MVPENPWQSRPTSYIEAAISNSELAPVYELAFRKCSPVQGKVQLAQLQAIVNLAGLPTNVADKILNLCIPPGEGYVSRNTFKLVLGLVALAQKNMDPSFENVQTYLSDLPAPTLPGLEAIPNLNSQTLSQQPSSSSLSGMLQTSKHTLRPNSKLLSDPWMTSGLSTGEEPISPHPAEIRSMTSSVGASVTGLKSVPGSLAYQNVGDPLIDTITIHLHDQLHGYFFKYVNYVVCSQRFGSMVLRRYSEFYALYQYLVKRFSYRLIPALPPKRIGVNDEFIEKRRKGLVRFLTFLTNHPVINNDLTLKQFLTHSDENISFVPPTPQKDNFSEVELAVPLYISDPQNLDGLVQDVPERLEPMMDRVSEQLRLVLNHYSVLIQVTERIAKRLVGDSQDLSDLTRLAIRPPSSSEETLPDFYPNDQYLPEDQFPFLMLHLQKSGLAMKSNADLIDLNVVELLKSLRDVAQGYLNTLVRYQSRPMVDVEKVKRRIKNNKITHNLLSQEPTADSKELSRLAETIQKDKSQLANATASEHVIRRTIYDEWMVYRSHQAKLTCQLIQDMVNDQIKFTNLSVHSWKALHDQISMLG